MLYLSNAIEEQDQVTIINIATCKGECLVSELEVNVLVEVRCAIIYPAMLSHKPRVGIEINFKAV